MVGGRLPKGFTDLDNNNLIEILYRFEFPERPGALMKFLKNMKPDWSISVFHYRNHGADVGRIVIGVLINHNNIIEWYEFVKNLGYKYWDESNNKTYKLFLGASTQRRRYSSLDLKIIIDQLIPKENNEICHSLVTKIEAVLYLKGKPVSKKTLSEITNSDINSVSDAIKQLYDKYSNPSSALEIINNNSLISLELKHSLNEYVEDLLPAELKTAVLRTLAVIAIKKKLLQSDLIILRGSSAYDHIKELLEKNFIIKRKQKDGRSFWLSLSDKFYQRFAVSNEFLSKIGESKK